MAFKPLQKKINFIETKDSKKQKIKLITKDEILYIIIQKKKK